MSQVESSIKSTIERRKRPSMLHDLLLHRLFSALTHMIALNRLFRTICILESAVLNWYTKYLSVLELAVLNYKSDLGSSYRKTRRSDKMVLVNTVFTVNIVKRHWSNTEKHRCTDHKMIRIYRLINRCIIYCHHLTICKDWYSRKKQMTLLKSH